MVSLLLSLSLSLPLALSLSRVDQVAVADVHATTLTEASNGVYGRNNKLAEFIATETPVSGDVCHRGYRWLDHRW